MVCPTKPLLEHDSKPNVQYNYPVQVSWEVQHSVVLLSLQRPNSMGESSIITVQHGI